MVFFRHLTNLEQLAGDEEDHAQDEVREVLVPQDEELGSLQALRVGCREEEEGPYHPRQISGLMFIVCWGHSINTLGKQVVYLYSKRQRRGLLHHCGHARLCRADACECHIVVCFLPGVEIIPQ